MERIVARGNLQEALKRVKKNRESPGVDGRTVAALPGYLREHWLGIREQLLSGAYRPQPVLRCEISKAGGGMRTLGIPTVDRFIQQAVLQVVQPRFDPSFSDSSFGFRPGRRAHDAVRQARAYIQDGRRYVVDVDLEKFFDRAKWIGDQRLLRLIRRYLEAGILADGVVMERHEGTRAKAGRCRRSWRISCWTKWIRHWSVAVTHLSDTPTTATWRSRSAGMRVMQGLRRLYAGLHLRINEAKSAVAPATDRAFLGFAFWTYQGEVKYAVAHKALAAMKVRVRQITRRNAGRSLTQVAEELRAYLLGWKAYFRLAQTPGIFRALDQWLRHRLRALQLKQWRRGTTIFRELRARGMSATGAAKVAAGARRWWRNSRLLLNGAMPNGHFDQLGVPRFAA